MTEHVTHASFSSQDVCRCSDGHMLRLYERVKNKPHADVKQNIQNIEHRKIATIVLQSALPYLLSECFILWSVPTSICCFFAVLYKCINWVVVIHNGICRVNTRSIFVPWIISLKMLDTKQTSYFTSFIYLFGMVNYRKVRRQRGYQEYAWSGISNYVRANLECRWVWETPAWSNTLGLMFSLNGSTR